MISIIVASADSELLQKLKQNIEDSIGVPYEVLAFDNSDGKKGLCQIYNEGISQAKYDLLCFMHEDIFFHTNEWGKIVIDTYNDNNKLGVLGIAGSSYKALTPSGWDSSDVDTEYSNIIQSFKYINKPTVHHVKNKGKKNLPKVAAVDGVWFCVPKKIAAAIPFDEATFQRFHCYDVDFCLSVGRHYDIVVTFDVLIHHFSEGSFNRTWLEEILKLHEKWAGYLPVYTENFTPRQMYRKERKSFRYFVKKVVAYQFPLHIAYLVLEENRRLLKLNFLRCLALHYQIIRYVIKYFFVKPKLR